MLHLTPEDHATDPPEKWAIIKDCDRWLLMSSLGGTLDSYKRKLDAEAARTSGPYVSLYEKEGRWFAGESVANWKPYVP